MNLLFLTFSLVYDCICILIQKKKIGFPDVKYLLGSLKKSSWLCWILIHFNILQKFWRADVKTFEVKTWNSNLSYVNVIVSSFLNLARYLYKILLSAYLMFRKKCVCLCFFFVSVETWPGFTVYWRVSWYLKIYLSLSFHCSALVFPHGFTANIILNTTGFS